MSAPINLNAKRAEKADDSRLWTAIDALEDLLADLLAGRERADHLAVHWFTKQEDGGYLHSSVVAGCTFQDHLALLEVGKRAVMKRWAR